MLAARPFSHQTMRSKYRTQDYYRAKTDRDKLYYAAGIPSNNWGLPSSQPPTFKTVSVREGSVVNAKVQADWYKRTRAGEFFDKPWLFLICSPDDDAIALQMGYDILKVALEEKPEEGKHRIRVHITESSKKWEKTKDERVFLLTNVYDDVPRERAQLIRDWAFRNEDNFRIICAAGDPSVLIRRLRLKFNAVFYVDPTRVVESEY